MFGLRNKMKKDMTAIPSQEPNESILHEMRALAMAGASVHKITEVLHERLNSKTPDIIATLWYFKHAFCLSLREVLPLRELIGTELEEEMDRLLLPAIVKAKEQWACKVNQPEPVKA
jgi:hypothetical protein